MDLKRVVQEIDNDMLKRLARVNPRLVYMLTSGYSLDPRYYQIRVTWDTTDIDHFVPGNTFPDRMYQFFWIWDITYALRRHNANAGVFGKYEQDYYAMRMPYVDARMRVEGRPRFDITDGMTPVESFFSSEPTNRFANKMWVLERDSSVVVDVSNTRAFLESELPYELIFTFAGLELGKCDLPTFDNETVECQLRKLGYLPPMGE